MASAFSTAISLNSVAWLRRERLRYCTSSPRTFRRLEGAYVSSIAQQEVLVQKIGKSTPTHFRTLLSRYFYFCMSLLMAGLVVWGFSRTVNANLFHAAPPRPLLLWIHGAAFSTWAVFFIVQSTLVRVHKVSWHRFLGWFGAGLATVMVPLGVTTAIIMTRFDTVVLHQTGADAFLAIPFYDMIAFGVMHRARHLLEETTGLPSPAGVHRDLRAHGRSPRPL